MNLVELSQMEHNHFNKLIICSSSPLKIVLHHFAFSTIWQVVVL